MTGISPPIVVTLIAKSGEALPQPKVIGGAVTVLADNNAVDLVFDGIDEKKLRAQFVQMHAGDAVDIIVQPTRNRRKKLLIADMESTIIEQEMLDELAVLIGLGEKVAGITRRAMNGELDFTAALKERVALLKGRPARLLAEAARRITPMPGAATLVATMKAHGARCWLVSGGFTYFAKPVADQLGFDRVFANELIIDGDRIAGEIASPILDKNTKRDLLRQACAESHLDLVHSLAVGDGANDVPMLEACNQGGGLGVAYRAKPSVRAAIPHQINHGNLTALLYAQGYLREEFVPG